MASERAAAKRGFLEICVESVAGVEAAVAGGADAIELCSALALGGLTPSAGLVSAALGVARPAGVAVRAMVRPRAGDFTYDGGELALAIAEARALLGAGVDGLVFGAVRDGALDADAIRGWRRALAADREGFTLHRAIDVVADPVASIDVAIALGFDQVLSSGGAQTAPAGRETLAAMVRRAGSRCRVVAGSGVRLDNVPALVAAGIQAIHSTARGARVAETDDPMGFGRADPPADAATVRALREAVDAAVRDRQGGTT